MIEIIGAELYQWDTGRSVSVKDVGADKVHFANQGDSRAVIMDVEDSVVKIPDYLFQTGKQLFVYAVANGVTIESKIFSVKKRERPENYVYEEDQRNYIYELIQSAEEATAEAERVAEELRTARENGEFVGPQGPQGEVGPQGPQGEDGVGRKYGGGTGEVFNDLENNTAGDHAHAEGSKNKATGQYSHSEGLETNASGSRSHTEGRKTSATKSDSHAEGNNTKANGAASHAEGMNNTAVGDASHVEGNENLADSNCCHAEGHGNKVTGYAGHGEGRVTEARGHSSHAEGKGTFASGAQQHVGGTYNLIDYEGADGKPLDLADDGRPAHQYGGNEYKERKSKHLRIEGNGTSDSNRSNAETLDWKGNHWLAGNGTAKDYLVDGKQDNPLFSLKGLGAIVGGMQNMLGNDTIVLKIPSEDKGGLPGTLVLQENTYYQFIGGTKKTLRFYNADGVTVGYEKQHQILNIYCGSITDADEFGIAREVKTVKTANAAFVGMNTDISISDVFSDASKFFDSGSGALRKVGDDGTVYGNRCEVDYPANSIIIIQTKANNHPHAVATIPEEV